MSDIEDKLLSIISEIFDIKLEDMDENITQETTKQWDSMNHFLIITEIEKEFGISISLEESIELLCFKKLLKFIEDQK